ncbi:MAG: choline-sulfatase, partial [Pseudomonadota bacterium]
MPQDKPNFLFIMADQMTAKALPLYGNKKVIAPNLERLAAGGVVFDSCYCNLPMCGPSRASLHCGMLPFGIGMYDNANEFATTIPTLPHYLRKLGYRTELAGKMHFVGPDQFHGYHTRHTTEIYPSNFAWTVDWSKGREYRPTNLTMAPVIESGPCIRSLQMDYDDEVEYYSVQAIYDLARQQDNQPFFLTVSFTSPHSPFVIGEDYWNLYRHDDIELPTVAEIPLDAKDHLSRNLHYCQARHLFTVTDEHRRTARHAYYGMISYIDEKVGRLVNTLEKTGLLDNTVVIFTSDHGEMMGERGMWYKQHFFDWAARVPLIVSCPQRFPAKRITQNVSLVDLMPTVLDSANNGAFTDLLDQPDGQSLYPALTASDASGADCLSDIAISEFAADGSTGPNRMVKRGPWKYMYLEGEDELLYHTVEDPNEIDNRIDHPNCADIAQALRTIALTDWDPQHWRHTIAKDQQRRLLIHQVTGGEPTYVPVVRKND